MRAKTFGVAPGKPHGPPAPINLPWEKPHRRLKLWGLGGKKKRQYPLFRAQNPQKGFMRGKNRIAWGFFKKRHL